MEKFSKALIALGAVLLIGVSIFSFYSNDLARIGQYGDIIGGLIGSIWSLAGIILFYIALTDQKKDIRTNQEALQNQIKALTLQTEEFKLQRNELEETRGVLKAQAKTFRIQQFESTFFNMMKLLQEIISELQIDYNNQKGKGRDFFKIAFQNLNDMLGQHNNLIHDKQESIKKAFFINHLMMKDSAPESKIEVDDLQNFRLKIIEVYEDFYKYHHHNLGHYFRFLFNIIKFTIHSDLESEEKARYLNLVQAQMSSYELGLVFYNSLSKHGSKIQPWLEQYGLLENIDGKALLIPLVDVRHYPSTKFKFISMKNYAV